MKISKNEKLNIDYHLEKINMLQSTLGIDSTKEEIDEVKEKQKKHEMFIKQINEGYYYKIKT